MIMTSIDTDQKMFKGQLEGFTEFDADFVYFPLPL